MRRLDLRLSLALVAVVAGSPAMAEEAKVAPQEQAQPAAAAPAEQGKPDQAKPQDGKSDAKPADASADKPKPAPRPMEIQEYRIEGTHTLSDGEIEAAVYPFLGPDKTSDDVEQARAALEKAYAAKGYQTVAVSIPPQQVKDGVVTLLVTEGKVGRLRVKGSQYYDIEAIKQAAPSLKEGEVPNFNDVSSDIVALNQLPDRKVTPSLRAGATPGTVDVDLTVDDKLPLHGSLELNNRYSANTSHYRVNGMVRYDNLWQLGHSLSLSYQVAPENPKDAKVFSGSYLARIPDWNAVSFLVYGVKQDSDVNTLGSMDVAGRGEVIGTRAVITLPGEEGFFHTLSMGPDYKHFKEAVRVGSSGYETPITYYPLTATWSATWQGAESLTQANLGSTMHFRGLGSNPDAWDTKRYKASGDFIYFRGDLSRTQEMWQGLQLFGKAQGQLSNAALISNEQFSAGGLDTVRGYLESAVLGDSGALGSVELRSPSLSRWFGESVINEWRFYTFAEGGRLTTHDALAEQASAFNVGSYGIGTRGKFLDYLNGSLDFAIPVTNQSPTRAGDPLMTFRLWTEF